jgi:hypothetical protein
MDWSGKLKVPQQVLAREVGTEVVILDLASGTYFGLDPVGARVWQLITAGSTPQEVCAALTEEYEVDRETAERDVGELIGELQRRGLVTG